jgi:hypothetical protein
MSVPGNSTLNSQLLTRAHPTFMLSMVEFVDRYPDLQETPAQFQERCGQIALLCFWKEQQGRMSIALVAEPKESRRYDPGHTIAPGDGFMRDWTNN